ncbi:hypothetical protein [Thioclava sp. F34-6]|uniref:hypothetical protein n=1 Tax=Thioclava sp. F34-6 TaxID=1973003 RepID=UPI0011BA4B0E|nr:hypothetical protein [Thioclava sp. F34-6]
MGDRLCSANPCGDLSRESNMVAGRHEQPHAPDLQDQQLVRALRDCRMLGQEDADDLVPMGLSGTTGATVPRTAQVPGRLADTEERGLKELLVDALVFLREASACSVKANASSRNQLHLLGGLVIAGQIKSRSSPRNQLHLHEVVRRKSDGLLACLAEA